MKLTQDCCDYCKHCYDHEAWSCDVEKPCINGNMFEEKEEKEKCKYVEIEQIVKGVEE